jgi:hypothetical protein
MNKIKIRIPTGEYVGTIWSVCRTEAFVAEIVSEADTVSAPDPTPAPQQATALTVFPGAKRITAEWV